MYARLTHAAQQKGDKKRWVNNDTVNEVVHSFEVERYVVRCSDLKLDELFQVVVWEEFGDVYNSVML